MDLKNKVAIVTGGGSGLGEATAIKLATGGAKVAVLDLNADAANAVAERIGGRAFAIDIADAEAGETTVATIASDLGTPRILVNCAGVGTPMKILGKDGPVSLAAFEKVVRINLIGTFNMMRLAAFDMAAMEPLKDGERGVIVNTTSVAAYEGQIGQEAYAASKAGIVGLTLPAARDLARSGIRVLAIAPGLVATPMMLNLPPDLQKALGDSVPFPQRLAEAREFSRLAQHMIENVMLNGEVVRLDGALRLPPK